MSMIPAAVAVRAVPHDPAVVAGLPAVDLVQVDVLAGLRMPDVDAELDEDGLTVDEEALGLERQHLELRDAGEIRLDAFMAPVLVQHRDEVGARRSHVVAPLDVLVDLGQQPGHVAFAEGGVDPLHGGERLGRRGSAHGAIFAARVRADQPRTPPGSAPRSAASSSRITASARGSVADPLAARQHIASSTTCTAPASGR